MLRVEIWTDPEIPGWLLAFATMKARTNNMTRAMIFIIIIMSLYWVQIGWLASCFTVYHCTRLIHVAVGPTMSRTGVFLLISMSEDQEYDKPSEGEHIAHLDDQNGVRPQHYLLTYHPKLSSLQFLTAEPPTPKTTIISRKILKLRNNTVRTMCSMSSSELYL